MTLQNKLNDKSARLGVIGLGYVGLPLAVEYAKAGFHVVGIDDLVRTPCLDEPSALDGERFEAKMFDQFGGCRAAR